MEHFVLRELLRPRTLAEQTEAFPDKVPSGGTVKQQQQQQQHKKSSSVPLSARKPTPGGKYRVTVCITRFGVIPHSAVLAPTEPRPGFFSAALLQLVGALRIAHLGLQNGWPRAWSLLCLCPLQI